MGACGWIAFAAASNKKRGKPWIGSLYEFLADNVNLMHGEDNAREH